MIYTYLISIPFTIILLFFVKKFTICYDNSKIEFPIWLYFILFFGLLIPGFNIGILIIEVALILSAFIEKWIKFKRDNKLIKFLNKKL